MYVRTALVSLSLHLQIWIALYQVIYYGVPALHCSLEFGLDAIRYQG